MERLIVCVTGADGFIGKNLVCRLKTLEQVEVRTITRRTPAADRVDILANIDILYHLAGVNRPPDASDFQRDNIDLTVAIVQHLRHSKKTVRVVVTSSTQAELDNPYGKSKLAAEKQLAGFAENLPINIVVYRLPGVFGKWCRPNYNSVVATFCHNVANGIALEIHNPDHVLKLVYIDDVVDEMIKYLSSKPQENGFRLGTVPVEFTATVGELAAYLQSFIDNRKSFFLPAVGNLLIKNLYSTFLSYLPPDKFGYPLEIKEDPRGRLAEWIKSPQMGQVFISTTRPGITRGNHYHHTKTEKFLVIQGNAEIRFRKIDTGEVINYPVSGAIPTVVDIPPGYTHSIQNTGESELITLFWANELFDPQKPDTYFLEVI
jgi:UDP-2-acetamido-2,6-beta-L-arabino-hexul-4-ose reductase